MAGQRYTRAEDDFLIACKKKGLGATEIYRLQILSGREVGSIQSRMERLGIVPKRKPPTIQENPSAEDYVLCDLKFCELMEKAIRLGLERAPIGIAKDDTPLVAKRIESSPIWSGCGSSAGACADLGSRSSFI